jgi:hypothetical protein
MLKELMRFPVVLYLPYTISTMKFVDLYQMGMPILAPSLRFLMELDDMVGQFSYNKYFDIQMFPRNTSTDAALFHAVTRPAEESMIPGPPWDPTHRAWWFKQAAFYEYPHVMHFDSWDELTETLVSIHDPGKLDDLMLRSHAMLRYRTDAQQESTETWRGLLARLLSR